MKDKSEHNSTIGETVSALMLSTTVKDAAGSLGIARSTLYKRLENHPEIKETVRLLNNSANKILSLSTLKAASKLIELIDHQDSRIAFAASKEVLDRAGVTAENSEIDKPVPLLLEFTRDERV